MTCLPFDPSASVGRLLAYFRACSSALPTMIFADFCVAVSFLADSQSLRTQRRPPTVSSTTFAAHLPSLHSRLLTAMRFAIICSLAQTCLPHTRFLSVRSQLCSALPSDVSSRLRPCAFATLHHRQVVLGLPPPVVEHAWHTKEGRGVVKLPSLKVYKLSTRLGF